MKKIALTSLVMIPVLVSCLTTSLNKEVEEEPRYPEWAMTPPKSEGYYFGIGDGPDLETAKIKSIINAGQQFKVYIHSELLEKTSGLDGQDDIIKTIEKQITDQGVIGAKFYDQFQDANGEYWVLTRAPLTCVLDVSESVLVSYKRDLKIENYVIEDVVQTVSKEVDNSPEYFYDFSGRINTKSPTYHVKVDGKINDWKNIEPIIIDPPGDDTGNAPEMDIRRVFLAHDNSHLFLRMDLEKGRPSRSELFYMVNLKSRFSDWERLLITEYNTDYNKGWQTKSQFLRSRKSNISADDLLQTRPMNNNVWENRTRFYNQSAIGKVKFKDGILETRYSLEELKLPFDSEIEITAWTEPGGPPYDVTRTETVMLSRY